MKKNKHVIKYLDYYCDSKNTTPFAVLLNGKWGSGKTFFIREYIGDKKEFLHISLYGLSDSRQIDEKIFESLHPILSNPKFKLATQAVSSIIKYSTKIDLNNDGKKDVLLNTNGITSLNFKNFAKTSKNKIIIFDDIERCDIEIGKLFGYINHLVEFLGQKIILIADEEKLLKKEKYKEIKEKLIGREFQLDSPFEEALGYFVTNIKNKQLKKHNKNISILLQRIFKQSGYNNLRILQQALSSFEYFFISFSSKSKDDQKLFEKLFYEYIVIFTEYRFGNIKSNEFFINYPYFFKSISKDEKDFHFLDKYDGISNWLTCFEVKTLGGLLQGKILSPEQEKEMIFNFETLAGVNKESWQNLYNCYNRSDEEFNKDLKDVEQKWNANKYVDFHVILHVFGMFLDFSDMGLICENKNNILTESKKRINILIENNKFPLYLQDQNSGFSWKESSYGLQYWGMKTKEWKQMVAFIEKKINSLKSVSIKEKITTELMPILKGESQNDQGLDLFMNYNFLHFQGKRESYFQYFDVDEFVKIILDSNRLYLHTIKNVFVQRYTEVKLEIKDIEKEIPFIQSVKDELNKEIQQRMKKFGNKKTPSIILLQKFIDEAIEPFIKNE